MAQSFSKILIHLVFSTRNRESLLHDGLRETLHRYMAVVLRNFGCPAVIINSVDDHVHILLELPRTVTVSDAAEEVKKTSSKWIKTQGAGLASFQWQVGFGAFSVSPTEAGAVVDYIGRQKEHHRIQSFMEEYQGLLEQHVIPFEEKYL